MQDFQSKCEAIRSLLPLIFWHLDYMPHALKIRRYGQAEGDGGKPPPKPVNVNCDGRCWTCLAYFKLMGKLPACPPEERWENERKALRRKYRITDLEEAITRLETNLAQAVWAVYVEPWPEPKTEPIGWEARRHRHLCAEDGIEALAHDVRGDILGYGDKRDPIENQIRQLASQGYGTKRIAKELRCRPAKVQSVLCVEVVRCE
jgi:hypothetical protein